MNRCRSSRNRRRGAAFLLLVVILLLVIVAATQRMVRSEVTHRKDDAARMRTRSLVRAAEVVGQFDPDEPIEIRLPVDEASEQFIEVSTDESLITARWFKGNKVIDQLTRKRTIQAESVE